jgi:hypothetical protein
MPRKTPLPPSVKTRPYTTRNLRVDLIERMRLVAALEDTTIEDVLNRAVEAGLDTLHRKARGGR